MRKLTKRSVAIVAGSVLAVAGGTAAFAYASGWFKGDSTVYANASAIQTLHATVDTRSLGNLYPGRLFNLPNVNVNNTNDYPVKINTIAVESVTTSAGTNCDADDADIIFGAIPPNTVLTPGLHSISLGTIKMDDTASENCAGQFMNISATLGGEIAPATS
ncbi:hypothetical protein HH310_04625 [Actinoplanes sp. TBRC 11911]|uniref:hypothetical protein n=1 Tax=Actinoplanes sp. TBRC 11911 TaxID=2729386 RepID=UPI00145FB716|nr:hypothetical protein [Actinoplanes sp. TBRC 11911]NMO50477.1 hypothetical protein [Actinoplanes sp. TBRC 11911]